jgi:hypothetical protein
MGSAIVRRALILNLCTLLFAAPLALAQVATQSGDDAQQVLNSCHVYQVTALPGSHLFGSDFIEAMAGDPAAANAATLFALTADLSTDVPSWNRDLYISRSSDGGAHWTSVARLDARYFNAEIGEGLRNALAVSPGAADFVVTTQRGAFQVTPQPHSAMPRVLPIDGPRISQVDADPSSIASKKIGDPVRATAVEMTADGKRMFVGYGYYERDPRIFSYHRDDTTSPWLSDGPLPHLPSQMDIFSMQFDDPGKSNPRSLYVGTGDQAFRYDLVTSQWTRIAGVGPDSAIHGMTTVGGLHLAACWSVYNPVTADSVERPAHARFFYHRSEDSVSPDVRAYSINLDPDRKNRVVVTSLTGVYISRDSGNSWQRLNNLPDAEFHSAHFNPDGTILVSGLGGTFLVNPFSNACSPHLKNRVTSSANPKAAK